MMTLSALVSLVGAVRSGSPGKPSDTAPPRRRTRVMLTRLAMVAGALVCLGFAVLLVPRDRKPCQNVGPVVAMNCGVTR